MKKYKVILSMMMVFAMCLSAGFADKQEGFTDEFQSMPDIDIESGDYTQTSSFDGALQAALTNGITSEAIYDDYYFKDGIIETNFVVYNGNHPQGNGGIIFRTNDFNANGNISNGYYVGAKPSSSGVKGCIMLGKFINGQWQSIKAVNASVNVGNNQAIRVEAQGSSIRVYHDGKKLIDVKDYSFTHGGIGFRTWQVPTLYKNFSVKSVFYDEFTVEPEITVEQGMYNKVHSFGGSLQGYVTDGYASLAMFDDEVFADGTLETNMTAYRGDDPHGNSGVVFRVEGYTDEGFVEDGYSVALKAKSSGVDSVVILGRYDNGDWTLLQQAPTSVTYGEDHNQNLKVEVYGNNIKVYHDGDLKINYNDSKYSEGDIGVFSYKVPSLYKNFKIIRGDGSYGLMSQSTTTQTAKTNGKAYENTFDSETSSGLQLYGGEWYFAGSAAQVKSAKNIGGKALVKGEVYDNFELTANVVCGDLMKRSKQAYYDAGIVFRVTNPGVGADNLNGYYYGFGPNKDKLFVGKFVEGKWSLIKELNYKMYALEDLSYDQSLRDDMLYELKVRAIGSELTFYLNGNKMFTLNDNTYTAGNVGMRLYANAKDCWAAYYDIKVLPLDTKGMVKASGSTSSSSGSSSTNTTSTHTTATTATNNTTTTSSTNYRKEKSGGVQFLNTENYSIDSVTFAVSFTYNGKRYYTNKTINGLTKDVISELVLNDGGTYNGTTTLGEYLTTTEKSGYVPSWQIQNCTGDITEVKSVLVLKINGKDYHIYKQLDNLSTDHMYKIIKSGDTYTLEDTF